MHVQKKWIFSVAAALTLVEALPAQTSAVNEPTQQVTGWRSVDEQPPVDPVAPAGSLTLPTGTWIKVQTDQVLSSDGNRAGDGFTATLMQPLVANGFVVARRGQTIGGRVVEAEKAPRGQGSSRLALELAELTLVDGRQVPIRTSLAEYEAGRSVGRDVTTVATTTGLGAAIGAVAEGGAFGAGIGAAAGAAAGTFGVLLTRGRATVVYPEAQLTFRLVAPLTVSTSAQDSPAFQPVTQADYGQGSLQPRRAAAPPPPRYPYPYYYGGYYDPFFYPGFYPGFYYGPSFFFFSGPRGHFGRGFVGGRFGRR